METPFMDYTGALTRTDRVAIGGCGRTGAALAAALGASARVVLVMDTSPTAFDQLPVDAVRQGRILPRIADITLESDLRAAGAQDADVFIAVSGSDAVNIMAAQIALHLFRVGQVICSLDDPVKRDLYARLDLTVISPTQPLTELALRHIYGRQRGRQDPQGAG